ncbi:hypothetical protein L1987_64286 [Smallanthus sonchifolius]|uniref:Uncharacterized protein n=1 Tax=Smallanthus sonchifolius TaxID=185202 RepID=A0ACB9CFM4_9ASTR|nr:hypothetical protein L1987_64286 [Smallanthus sonchifolius]
MASASSKHSQKHVGSKSAEMEEIVRYMSNLPSYLERGKPVQDRALNFGVLDWGRLEHWQYHQHKQSGITANKHSPSGSNSSKRSSLHSHLNISTEDISTKDAPVSHSREKKSTNRSRTKPRGLEKNDLHPQDLVESKSSDDMGSFMTASSSSSSKGKMKIQDELGNKTENFQDSSYETCDGTKFSDTKSDTPNSFPFKNEIVSQKNSKNEADSTRKPSITCQIKTPEEKECSVSSKNSDFKTGSIAAGKNRFSFSMSSKSSAPEDSKLKSKVKMDLGNCKEVRVDNSCKNKMNDSPSSSRKRALFQMAVKNGRPLFTFSVDNNNNEILAATVRSLAGKDDTNSWIYTFFTIHEVKKKKSGWLYHSSKDKGNGYLPNVTAQMTVSNPTVSNCTTREFVLSSVDSGQPDHQTLDVQLENELEAIVVQFLRKASEDENQDYFSATVILPGGHHSVPRKGEPSPLIERWRTGGRCDCGGWDVGCRLRTLVNKVQSNRISDSPESFDLFLQGDVINERPFFSLSPIKEGIFSVDYNASLSLLHSFSICISVIECRKSSHQTEHRTYVAKRVDDDVAPVTYASLPPVSPVGRV